MDCAKHEGKDDKRPIIIATAACNLICPAPGLQTTLRAPQGERRAVTPPYLTEGLAYCARSRNWPRQFSFTWWWMDRFSPCRCEEGGEFDGRLSDMIGRDRRAARTRRASTSSADAFHHAAHLGVPAPIPGRLLPLRLLSFQPGHLVVVRSCCCRVGSSSNGRCLALRPCR